MKGKFRTLPRLIGAAVLVGLLIFTNGQAAGPIGYSFTLITDNTDDFAGVGNFPGEISINNRGEVAFHTTLASGTRGVFSGDGNSITTIIDSAGSPFFSFNRPIINNRGSVAFKATEFDGRQGIFVSDGSSLTTIADNTNPLFWSFEPFISMNDRNGVAFHARFGPSLSDGAGIFVGDGGDLTTIAEDTNGFFDREGGGLVDGFLSINNANTVVFRGTPAGGVPGIFVGDGIGVSPTVDADGPLEDFGPPAINERGLVAFAAEFDAGPVGIFLADKRGALDTVIAGPPFNFLRAPSINNRGKVAFKLFPEPKVGGVLMVGSIFGTTEVIANGDPLFGSTLQDFQLLGNALNDGGQIAFTATLADGRAAIVRADPIRR